MTRITGEIVIGAPAEVVFDFAAADQRNGPAYNPHVVRSAKVAPGPAGKGTQFRSAVRSQGRLAEMALAAPPRVGLIPACPRSGATRNSAGTGHSQRWRVGERSAGVFLSAG